MDIHQAKTEAFKALDREIGRLVRMTPVDVERLKELKAKRMAVCPHENEHLIREGSWCGRVTCEDCGRSREWNAY